MATELYHNSEEQVDRYLTAALRVVEKVNPPDDLREAAFNHAVSMLSAKTLQVNPHDLGGVLLAGPAGIPQ